MTPEVEARYITIIDSILAASDLNTISEKRIRKGLQAAVDYDITPQKVIRTAQLRVWIANISLQEPIKALILSRFDVFVADKNPEPQTNGHTNAANGQYTEGSSEPKQELSPSPPKKARKRVSDDDDLSDVPTSPSKKKKRKSTHIDEDALFAAKLQAEENGRARATRGGVNKKPTPVKRKKDKKSPRKKTSDKVRAEDDSDLEGSDSEAVGKKVNRSGGFHVSRARTRS